MSNNRQTNIRFSRFRIGFSIVVLFGLAAFGYWFAAVTYKPESRKHSFSSHKTDRAVYEDDLTKVHDLRYPALDDPPESPNAHEKNDEVLLDDASGEVEPLDGTENNLFRYLPADSLVYAYVDLENIRKIKWLLPVLRGKQFPWIAEKIAHLGIDINKTRRISFAFDKGSSSVFGVHKLGYAVKGWKSAMKNPYCVAAEIDQDRRRTLRLFSSSGALTANIILGHRIYHKDAGYSLTLPGRGLLLAAFRRPMANLLGLLVGRTDVSAKSTSSFKTLEKMLEDGPGDTFFAMVSNPEHIPASGLKTPGGGVAREGGFTLSILDSDLYLRWFMQLDSPRSAKRFIFRAKRYLDEFRLKYWSRVTGLSKSLNTIVFERNKDQVITELRLPKGVYESFLEYFKNY